MANINSLTQPIVVAVSLVLGAWLPLRANASSPAESVRCTTAPKSEWVSEARIRAHFDESHYVQVFFKTSKHNCYEFYAIGKDGSIVEAYYDPVSMRLMRYSRVNGNGSYQGNAGSREKLEPNLEARR